MCLQNFLKLNGVMYLKGFAGGKPVHTALLYVFVVEEGHDTLGEGGDGDFFE